MIIFGDLYQLRPVCGKAIFKDHPDMCGTHLWRDLFHIMELTENVRQVKDPVYAQLLNRIRVGKHLPEDIQLLLSRHIKYQPQRPETAYQHIFPTGNSDSRTMTTN